MPDARAVEAMMKYNGGAEGSRRAADLNSLHPPAANASVSFDCRIWHPPSGWQ
jgi:hypothetical protein